MIKKSWLALLIVVILGGTLVIAGCGNPAAKSGDTVKVDYTLTVDGKVFDTSVGKTPFEFTLGTGAVITGFDKAVTGMKVGESKTVNLTPAEGYGARDESKVYVVQPTQLPTDVTPTVGMILTSSDANGNPTQYTITAIDDSGITIDGNSPLAGKNLTFEIKLLEIEKKTATPTTTATTAAP